MAVCLFWSSTTSLTCLYALLRTLSEGGREGRRGGREGRRGGREGEGRKNRREGDIEDNRRRVREGRR